MLLLVDLDTRSRLFLVLLSLVLIFQLPAQDFVYFDKPRVVALHQFISLKKLKSPPQNMQITPKKFGGGWQLCFRGLLYSYLLSVWYKLQLQSYLDSP